MAGNTSSAKKKTRSQEKSQGSTWFTAAPGKRASRKQHGRRMQDAIDSRDLVQKLNLDRRQPNSERRRNSDPNYAGPARRMTIDRRVNLKDRRQSED